MGYERRPFNPATPYPNQVATELNKANDNFDLLAQAFENDNPETLKVKNALNSDNAVNSVNALNSETAINSDTVDGFHASQTPAPNTIPVALSTGKLDLNWLPDDIGGYGYRRIDLTNATTDYDLQLGEEAYYVWNTTSSISLPLRITVSGMLYQLIIFVSNRVNGSPDIHLDPNNIIYSSAFRRTYIQPSTSATDSSVSNVKNTLSRITYHAVGGGGQLISWLQTTTTNKGEMHFSAIQNANLSVAYFLQGSHRWNDTTTVWSSLGTLSISSANGTIYVLVRRVL